VFYAGATVKYAKDGFMNYTAFLRHFLKNGRMTKIVRRGAGWGGRLIVVCAVMLVLLRGLLAGVRALGYEVNFSRSMPIGLYAVTQDSLYRGQMVAACLPAAVATFGRARGYLGAGECEDGSAPVLKRIVAMEGDAVEVRQEGVWVNGHPVTHSAVRAHDPKGRELPRQKNGVYLIPPGELLLMGTDPLSWDGRYFGPVAVGNVVATAQMVLVALPSGAVR
jgi:conjugative transfer signal peptidase TraF